MGDIDVLIIGAGAAGSVVAKKCVKNARLFKGIHVASRNIDKCEKLQSECGFAVSISQVDANSTEAVIALIQKIHPNLVINMALPYQDIPIMEACLATGVHYMDTANYESPEEARYSYSWQWAYHDRFKEKGIMALLGCGFDPGVTNVFCSYAKKELFDEIRTVDILDCNDGNHGHPFATNFNPEINIREITQPGKYFEKGSWIDTAPLEISQTFDFPEVGPKKAYLINHEEMESLVLHLNGLQRMRFWMTFSENYLNHLRVLQNVGLTRIEPIEFQGQRVVPLHFLKALLPDPSSLGVTYKGKTCIGCLINGKKDGKDKTIFIYNICRHEDCFEEVRAQAVSYTTGVPAMIGASLILQGIWAGKGVFNVEQMDPAPFMENLNQHGLPWHIKTYS